METFEKKGTQEIVDTTIDAIKVEMSLRGQFGQKFDILNFLQGALSTYPKVKEAAEDWPNFLAEVRDLTPEESASVTSDIERGLSGEEIEKSRLLRFIRLVTKGHVNIEDGIQKFNELKGLAIHVVAKD